MPSNDRWGTAALAGTAVAAGGAGMMLHGNEQASAARSRIATHMSELPRARQTLADAQGKLNQYHEGLKVNRASVGVVVDGKRMRGSMPSPAERKAAEQPYRRSIAHAKGRITGHEREITRQGVREMGAKRVKRIGSGVLGAGATLGTLGVVMAERKRRSRPPAIKATPPPPKRDNYEQAVAGRDNADRERRQTLKEMRRKYVAKKPVQHTPYKPHEQGGGLLRDDHGKPKGLSPSAGRDWLKANKDRA